MTARRFVVSVIVPFHTELELIGRTVASVTAQETPGYGVEYEVLIGNDGDHDEATILSAVDERDRPVVRVVDNVGPKGPGGARNAGLGESRGNLIAFLDADDRWLPGKMARQLAEIDRGATFVATGYRFQGGPRVVTPPGAVKRPIEVFTRLGIGTSTVMVSRELQGDTRFANLRFAQDIEYWYRLAGAEGFRYAAVESAFVEYSPSGSTRNKLVQLQHFHRVLSLHDIPYRMRARILLYYGVRGLLLHYWPTSIRT